jgi:hypothetical protein
MLTAHYLTDTIGFRPEFKNELDMGDMSASDIIPSGSHVSVKMYSLEGYMSLPGYVVRFDPYEKN